MESSSRRGSVRSGILMALVASCAVGVGITGTLLWTQSHTPDTPKAASVAPPVAPVPPSSDTAPSVAGMTAPQAALILANWNYDHQRWPQAIEQYQSAIAGGLDNPDVRTDLGSSYRFGSQPQKALEQYIIAQKQDPTHELSLYNQGGLLTFDLNDPKKGVAAWRLYVKKFPHGTSAKDARNFIENEEKKNVK